MKSTNLKGTLILVLVAMIWGTGFVAQDEASKHLGAFAFNATRNLLATAFVLGLLWWRNHYPSPFAKSTTKLKLGAHWWPGFLIGDALFLGETFQQIGIAAYPAGAAASGRAGFLTSTYVVFVAVIAWLVGRTLSWIVMVSVATCLVGMYLLCVQHGLGHVYLADWLEIICAFMFTLHILVIDRYRGMDSLALSAIQFATASALAALFAGGLHQFSWTDTVHALVTILYAGIVSSGIGYTLQVIGQQYAEPTSASIAMSLESVFAALAGWILLNEVMNGREIMVGILVFAAVIIAQVPEFLKAKAEK